MELTPHSILSVNQAVKAMHGRDSRCRRQLRDWGVIRDMGGTPCVIYGDILAKLRERERTPVVTPRKRTTTTTLRRL
jgi:hypothetical protein